VLIFRPESGLLYFNVDHVRDAIAERAQAMIRRQSSSSLIFPPRRMWTCKARTPRGAGGRVERNGRTRAGRRSAILRS